MHADPPPPPPPPPTVWPSTFTFKETVQNTYSNKGTVGEYRKTTVTCVLSVSYILHHPESYCFTFEFPFPCYFHFWLIVVF